LFIDFALTRPRLYDYMFTAPRPGARQFPGDFAAGKSPTINLIVEAMTDGMRRGVLRDDDPISLALALAAQLHGFVALYHGGRIGVSDDTFRALCHDNLRRIFDGIRACNQLPVPDPHCSQSPPHSAPVCARTSAPGWIPSPR
jgi:hypothetical protein